MTAIDTRHYKGYKIEIHSDSDTESPLEHDSMVQVSYRKSGRYVLGNAPHTPQEHAEIGAKIDKGELIGLPMWAYIHSGTALKACEGNPFGCLWDSGQSGYVWITPPNARKWLGVKRLTKAKRARMLEALQGLIDEYSKWCNGECYGYIVWDAAGDEVDALWGMIGFDYCLKEAEGAVDDDLKSNENVTPVLEAA